VDTSPTGNGTGSAAPIVHGRLLELTEQLAVDESRVRQRLPGSVHRMRVTLRRLRSLLASFGDLYDEPGLESLRDELTWIAGELGRARDVEVLRTRLSTLARTPEEQGLVDRALVHAESVDVEASVAALDSERFERVIRALNDLVATPPREPDQGLPVDEFLRLRVRRDWRRLWRRAARADELTQPDERQVALHEVRKSAKRLRYAAETLVPAYGKGPSRLARRAKRLQTDLGEVQDSAVAQGRLRDLAALDGTSAEEVTLLHALLARERQRASEAEARYTRAWSDIARRKYRRWLVRRTGS
jgi:CHAD domain-containing protein